MTLMFVNGLGLVHDRIADAEAVPREIRMVCHACHSAKDASAFRPGRMKCRTCENKKQTERVRNSELAREMKRAREREIRRLHPERYAAYRARPGVLERKRENSRKRRELPGVRERERAYMLAWRSVPDNVERERAYRRRPEVKARARERATSPLQRERERAYRRRPEVRARDRDREREYRQRPQVRERERARRARPEIREHNRARARAYFQRPEVRARNTTPEARERQHRNYAAYYYTNREKELARSRARKRRIWRLKRWKKLETVSPETLKELKEALRE